MSPEPLTGSGTSRPVASELISEDAMKGFFAGIYKLNISFQVIAGLGLVFIICVTLLDIIMRQFGRPIIGAMELVSFSGAIIIGFALPYSSWMKAHVYVDLLLVRLPPRTKRVMEFCTKLAGFLLFALIGVNFAIYGFTLIQTGEVSPGFRIPYYPIAFGLALASFMESLTLLTQLWRGRHD
jgi:TRAP-type C4-dicarboxylate transport system permease small subunit